MHQHRPPLANTDRDTSWKHGYLKKNALLNAVVSVLVLFTSLLVHIPDPRFFLGGVLMGAFSYFAWSNLQYPRRFVWLVPLVIFPAVWLTVEFGTGATKLLRILQLMATIFAVLSACFVVERYRGSRPTPRSTDEAQ